VRHDLDKTLRIEVDRTIGDIRADEFDAVHLPGGAVNADSLRMEPQVQAFLQAMQAAGKPFAVICHAPWELVSAGLVWPIGDRRQRDSGDAMITDEGRRRRRTGT
jgi:putative intracellular protease/amidase